MKNKLSILVVLLSNICYAQFQEIPIATNSSITEIVYKEPYLYINGLYNYFSKLNINTNSLTLLTPIANSNFQCASLNIIDSNSFWGLAVRPFPFSDYLIKRTIDGGQSWINSSDTLNVGIFDLKMISNTEGYVVGSLGQFLKFNNSTQNWDSLNLGIQYQNLLVNTIEDSTIIIGSINFVHTSHDKGATWTISSIDVQPSCIFIQNKDTIYLTTNLYSLEEADIYKTTNSGNNWQTCYSTLNYSINSIAFFNSTHGIAVGANKITNKGEIFVTEDAAQTWQHYSTQYDTEFNNITIVNDSTIFISSSDGRLFKTNKEILLNTLINNIENQNPVTLFPNPANEFLNIRLENTSKFSTSIFDVFGNEINLYPIKNDNTITYNTQSLKQGLYVLRVITHNQSSNYKFQIIR
ncbi:MAG: T9SS type A sorting domain-containing protein [Bacteroidia bacterium]|nr:T9SS type A sorting domain-containing protein [Bacteroidia bacterium]MCZ2248194.1 T9SS type A sorting domain-containing protein [Bacteroidia bacterium]